MVWEEPKLLELSSGASGNGDCDTFGSSAADCWNGPSPSYDCGDGGDLD